VQAKTCKLIAFIEAISYLVLLVAVVFKHVYGQPAGVEIVGPLHGLVFLAYFMGVLFVREDQGWGLLRVIVVLLAALIPFGAFWVERRLVTLPPSRPESGLSAMPPTDSPTGA
jgi:integral membrane protein